MKTDERARHLARAAAGFPLLGAVTAPDLIELIRLELGHPEILDGYRRYGSIWARALPPERLLLILSGATPHAALQGLIRGLLLGGPVRCKLPGGGLPEFGQFCELLPPELRAQVEYQEELPREWVEEADVVVAFGNDATLAAVRKQLGPDQRFFGHGHRISLGLVTSDPDFASVPAAARDVSLFDQRGCLSPHAFYVAESEGITAHAYAGRLARAMAAFQLDVPRRSLSLSEHAAIRELRRETIFRAANGEPLALWQSENDTAWTVIYDATDALPDTPLNRLIFVKPLPADLPARLAPLRRWVSAVGCWPLHAASAALAVELGASRVCRIGEMQRPSPFWHQDGHPQLAGLVRWIDCEAAEDL